MTNFSFCLLNYVKSGKMIAEYYGNKIPTEIALAVIIVILGAGVGLSLMEKEEANQ